MECPSCGSENAEDAKFCVDCGVLLISSSVVGLTPKNIYKQMLVMRDEIHFVLDAALMEMERAHLENDEPKLPVIFTLPRYFACVLISEIVFTIAKRWFEIDPTIHKQFNKPIMGLKSLKSDDIVYRVFEGFAFHLLDNMLNDDESFYKDKDGNDLTLAQVMDLKNIRKKSESFPDGISFTQDDYGISIGEIMEDDCGKSMGEIYANITTSAGVSDPSSQSLIDYMERFRNQQVSRLIGKAYAVEFLGDVLFRPNETGPVQASNPVGFWKLRSELLTLLEVAGSENLDSVQIDEEFSETDTDKATRYQWELSSSALLVNEIQLVVTTWFGIISKPHNKDLNLFTQTKDPFD